MAMKPQRNPDRATDVELVALDDVSEHEEPTEDEILESIRRGMEDVKAGRTRPARQAIEEIRSKLAADADKR